ncbi:flagellar protein FlgN [Clostridium pasteurianum]|uniref:FlgN protein n=1 Tax=Clostridium pasteurianum BC1 TaxID=86416 RepID=R4K5F0_CLOPA|nr:flagellar protein FlgN [Clostridium pasteurianum]AGK97798.1 FlgN protein [Clostridium pasteurianum BC1]
MKEQLKDVMVKEYRALKELLESLDRQHELYLKNDIFQLEDIVKTIESNNRVIAELEVERRKITGANSMNEIVRAFEDEELENNYRNIKRLLQEIKVQKESNELLFRQGLVFTNRILNIFSPNKNLKTYNSLGRIGK